MAALRGLSLEKNRAAVWGRALGQQGFRDGPQLHSAVLAARHQEGLLQPEARCGGGETPAEPQPDQSARSSYLGLQDHGPDQIDCSRKQTAAVTPTHLWDLSIRALTTHPWSTIPDDLIARPQPSSQPLAGNVFSTQALLSVILSALKPPPPFFLKVLFEIEQE